MPITITVSGESAKEVKELVADLASTVFGIPNESFPTETTVSTVNEVAATKEDKPKQQAATKQEAPKQDDTPAGEVITIELLRALAQEKSKSAGSQAVREVLAKYGGLPKAKPEQYEQIKSELESL